MTIARVAASAFAGGASSATTTGIDTTGANLLVIAVTMFSGTATVSDSKSNTYTAGTLYGGTNDRNQFFYCLSPTVGTGHTATVNGSFASVALLAYSGVSAFDQTVGANSASPGTLTPAGNNELLLTACADGGLADPTSASGFTTVAHLAGDNTTRIGSGVAELIQTTGTAASPTWTVSSPTAPTSGLVAFTASAGGNTFNVSVAETGTLLDAPTPAVNFLVTVTETGAAADSESANTNGTFNDSVAESGSAADAVSASVQFSVTVNEAGTLADAESAVATYVAQLLESGAALDSFPVTAILNVGIAETSFASDSVNIPGQKKSTHFKRFFSDIGTFRRH